MEGKMTAARTLSVTQLAKKLGVSRDRVHKIIAAMIRAKWLTPLDKLGDSDTSAYIVDEGKYEVIKLWRQRSQHMQTLPKGCVMRCRKCGPLLINQVYKRTSGYYTCKACERLAAKRRLVSQKISNQRRRLFDSSY
jgi:hypothetical protein